jgi:hypothetical protein
MFCFVVACCIGGRRCFGSIVAAAGLVIIVAVPGVQMKCFTFTWTGGEANDPSVPEWDIDKHAWDGKGRAM